MSDSHAVVHSRRFWVNLTFLCAVLGLCEAARGIVIPTLSLYVTSLGGSSTFLSVVVAAFSVGRLTSSVVLGYISDYCGMRAIISTSVAITCIGHVLFIAADGVSTGGLYLLLTSRILTGFGTGTLSVCRSFVSKHTASGERTRFMSWLGIVQFAGYAFTPILGGLEVSWPITASWTINTFTAGTYALLVLDVVLLAALYVGLSKYGAEEEAKGAAAMDMIAAEAKAVERTAADAKEGGMIGRGDMVETTTGRVDEPVGAVAERGGKMRHGYTAVKETQMDSDSDSLSDHEASEMSVVDSVNVLRNARAMAESDERQQVQAESEMMYSTPSAASTGDNGTSSATALPPTSLIAGDSLLLQRSQSVATPIRTTLRLSASRPPLLSPRNTSAPAGLTAPTLATLATPSLPRDVRSSSSLDSLYSLPSSFEPPTLSTETTTSTASSWRTRCSHLTSRTSYCLTPSFLIPCFFLLLNAASRGCLAVAETYGSTLYYSVEYGEGYDASAVNPLGAAWFYTALGALGVVVFILMESFTHFLNELTLLCWGFIAMTLGFITVLDTDGSIVNLAFSMSMIYCIATPITQTLVSSMLSKQLPRAQQGKWMGLLTAAGSIGRIVFPLLSGLLYMLGSTDAALLLPAIIAMCAVSGIFVGLKVWQLWWTYWVRVERRLVEWRERRAVGGSRRQQVRRESWSELEESWLTIEQVMERMHRRANSKAKRKHRQRHMTRGKRQDSAVDMADVRASGNKLDSCQLLADTDTDVQCSVSTTNGSLAREAESEA